VACCSKDQSARASAQQDPASSRATAIATIVRRFAALLG
jgi:hypothetical protein